MEIHLIFTRNNKLKISLTNNVTQSLDLKVCFSLVYSIENIDGGTISKKIGRYYEIFPEKNEIILTLQNPRIGSYNLSCGPEGLFVIDSKEKKLECVIHPLKFEKPIPLVQYTDDQEKILNPVIPNSSKVSIVSLQDLNPVSISTIVGKFVTLDIKYDLVLTSCNVVKPMSGKPRSLAITPPDI